MQTMTAIRVTALGGPEVLRPAEVEVPTPGPGQILIKVAAAGVNYADIHQRRGTYPAPTSLPMTPGWEVAGTVAAHGPGGSAPPPGTRVAVARLASGGYAEYAVADAASALPVPDGVADVTALGLLSQGMTAYFLLRGAAPTRPGQSVLVHAAAGGVGSLAVQLAKAFGAGTVVGTAGSPDKLDLVRRLGADAAVDYTAPDWPNRVKELTGGRGADIILDAAGGAVTAAGLACLAPFGRLVAYGATGAAPAVASLTPDQTSGLIFANQSLVGMSVYGYLAQPGRTQQAIHELLDLVAAGTLRVVAGGSFPLTRAADAHAALEARKLTGKVVLTV